MSRTSLHRPRRNRAVCHRPAAGTRLLPNPFPPGDGRSIDSTRHTHLLGHSRGYAPFLGRPAPAIREGLYPGTVGFPEAVAPRVYSPVASLGTPSSHGDGKEVTPDPLRMVERFPHTDRPEVPFRPVPSRVWRRLAPQPTRPRHGPSIAFPSPGEPVRQRRIIPAPEPVEDVQDAPRRAPRRESISKGGAAHPELAESPPRRIEGSSGGRPAPIPHSTLIHRDLPHSLSFRGSAQNVGHPPLEDPSLVEGISDLPTRIIAPPPTHERTRLPAHTSHHPQPSSQRKRPFFKNNQSSCLKPKFNQRPLF